MPLTRIEVRRPRPAHEVQAVIDAVAQALRDALQLPEGDRQLRYVEHRPEHFAVPPGKSENYTLVEVAMFPGRSLDAKRTLYRLIVQRLGALGIAPSDILIVLNEPPLENWGVRGGVPGNEVELGFKLDV
jgi:phenylpyruvate tautomerase PptA (4-oxalocrotonate tautomerase family)